MDKRRYITKLGKNIAKIRKEKGLTASLLGDECGKDRQSIERLEKGDVNPSVYYLYQISKGLKVPASKLLEF